MTFWFLDASVLLAREDADDDQHEAARELLAGDATLATLDLAYYEVGNDAGYVAGAVSAGMRLVSCDVRDLVNRGLAVTPRQACPTA